MKIIYSIFMVTLLIIFSCKNSKSGSVTALTPAGSKEIKTKGILNNKTGLDGCGWVIKLLVKDKNGKDYLEPINLNSFKISLAEEKQVEVIYTEENLKSACMVGTVVSLKSIKEIK